MSGPPWWFAPVIIVLVLIYPAWTIITETISDFRQERLTRTNRIIREAHELVDRLDKEEFLS